MSIGLYWVPAAQYSIPWKHLLYVSVSEPGRKTLLRMRRQLFERKNSLALIYLMET